MHPSQKWPSIAVCLLLIGTIVYLGIINNNSINQLSGKTFAERKVPANSPIKVQEKVEQQSIAAAGELQSENEKGFDDLQKEIGESSDNNLSTEEQTTIQNNLQFLTTQSFETLSTEIGAKIIAGNFGTNNSISKHNNQDPSKELNNEAFLDKAIDLQAKKQTGFAEPASAKKDLSFENDNASKKLSHKNSFRHRTSVQYYITPSSGFRTLKQKSVPSSQSLFTAAPMAAPSAAENLNINDKVTQSFAVNLEAGAGISYQLSKKFSVTTGIQFNYTNYTSYANDLAHPESADIYVLDNNGNYELARSSSYANTVNGNYAVLNNSTIQFSIPIGLEYTVLKAGKIKWNVGGSIQTGIIASGKNYVLSTDNTHYIKDRSLLSSTILNSSLQTTVSYTTKNGVSIFAGPQLRYQLNDTHKRSYNYSERLYNYGLKIGISRGL